MAQVRLHAFADEAKELVRTGHYDEAIAICRHILKQYPKHIESYRILAEACLQKGDQEQAADLFKRVLSADPHDFIAYVGLGILHEEGGLLDEAIWQFERAFELAPANRQVRQELIRLYGQRDGYERERLKLNRAALGHMYLKGGLEAQAIAEFEEILAQDPDRLDIQLALAEALYRANRRREAAEVCQEILNQSPHCLKANLLLGEIWAGSGMQEEGETLLQRAQSMDPENLLAREILGEDSPLPPAEAMIERPDDLSTLMEETAAVEVAAAPEPAPWDALLQEVPAWPAAEAPAAEEEEEELAETVSPEELPELSAALLEETIEAQPAAEAELALPAEEAAVPEAAEAELAPGLEGEPELAGPEEVLPPETASPEEIMAWVQEQRQGPAIEASTAEIEAASIVELEPAAPPTAEESESPVIAALEQEFGALPELSAQEISAEERAALEASMPSETASADEIMAWVRQHAAFPVLEEPAAVAPMEERAEAKAEELAVAGVEEQFEAAQPEVEMVELAAETLAEAPEAAEQMTEPVADEAEELVPAAEPALPEVAAEPEPLAMAEPTEEPVAEEAVGEPELEPVEPATIEETTVSIEEPAAAPTIADYIAQLAQDATDQPARLALARAYADGQEWGPAAEQYGLLIQQAPDLLPDLVADLEAQALAHPEQAALQQALGDAYMESGQLQEALDIFNRLLKQVK